MHDKCTLLLLLSIRALQTDAFWGDVVLDWDNFLFSQDVFVF